MNHRILISLFLAALVLGIFTVALSPGGLRGYPADSREIAYVGSESCRKCHAAEYEEWRGSVHALAERPIDPEREKPAFDPPNSVVIAGTTSEFFTENGECVVKTLSKQGGLEPFKPIRILGEIPLRQFIVPAERGALQVTSLAFDPDAKEWFDVFGEEDRRPHEWGFWGSRGMNWNSMCAECHNTRVHKNYDLERDSYHTTMEEMGVGCESCHGPGEAHVDWHEGWVKFLGEDPLKPLTAKQTIDTCGQCHARRTSLTEEFYPGDLFLDHYVPELPNDTDVYHPDGQVRDENYEYSSFLMSRMYHEGVKCIDCHLPHSSKTKFEGNALCMQCHAGKIHPTEHGRHSPDQPGGLCIDCHMPTTIYMQRQPRHDHGFTIPDPKLTMETGTPNACNRCHTDQTPEWAAEWVDKWWGPVEDRITGKRSRAVAAARRNDPNALPELARIAGEDPFPAWRAIAVGLLRNWMTAPSAAGVAQSLLNDPEPLVRTLAVDALERVGDSMRRELRRMLDDPVRSVRIRAAWVLHTQLEDDHPAFQELQNYLRLSADQPVGALQLATLYRQRNRLNEAAQLLARAVEWSRDSEILWEALSGVYSQAGRQDEARATLEEARSLLPDSAPVRFWLGLAHAESSDLQGAVGALTEACEIDPQFGRAWYNLGLAYHGLGEAESALSALESAVRVEPENPDYTYAMATVCRDLGRIDDALHFTRLTLSIQPNHTSAARLLSALGGGRR